MKALDELNKKFGETNTVATQFTDATKDIGKAAESAGKGAEKGSSGIGKFLSSVARIAKYRMIRAVIKTITSAFSEGLANVREYSNGVEGEGSRIANVFNSMTTHTNTMKNQLGSAFAELLSIIMPIIEKLVSIVTKAADAVSQFFAALGGNSGYYKAVDSTADMAKSTASGAKAAKEWKRQLMGFDVINRLDKPNDSSGGGGGSKSGASDAFEYTELDAWTGKVAELRDKLLKLWDVLKTGFMKAWNFIKTHFDFGDFFNNLCDVFEGTVEIICGLLTGDWRMVFSGAAKVVEGLVYSTIQVISFVQAAVSDSFDWIKEIFNNAFDWAFNWIENKTGATFSTLKNALSGFITLVQNLFNGLFDGIKKILDGIATFISGIFTGNLRKAGDGIVKVVKGVVNMVISLVETVINAAISAINMFLVLAQTIVRALGGSFNVKLQPITLPRFASGGFPEDGLFMANHGELVGQFSNGNTAVANNEQIIEGIKRGVFEAMTAAMSGNGNGQTHTTEISINGRQFFRAVWDDYKAVAREHGVKLVNNV